MRNGTDVAAITAIHKANIMKLQRWPCSSSARGSWRPIIRTLAYDEQIVDAACMNLVMKPETFDMLLLPNPTATSCRISARAWWEARTVGAANLGATCGA